MPENPVTKAYGPRSTRSSQTLYERMGGEAKLEIIVDGVYKLMRDDKTIGKQFARFRLERLKDRTVDYLRGEFGGTEYNGSDLWISHSHLVVKNDWYDIMMKYYVQMLKKVKMPPAETAEILEALEKMRKPIVDPGQKLRDMYLKHCREEDEKVGGDGWTVKTKATASPPEVRRASEASTVAATPPSTTVAKEVTKTVRNSCRTASAEQKPAQPRREGRSEKARAAADTTKQIAEGLAFLFTPQLDGPPTQLPSSRPSAAELLYRLANGAPEAGWCVGKPLAQYKSWTTLS